MSSLRAGTYSASQPLDEGRGTADDVSLMVHTAALYRACAEPTSLARLSGSLIGHKPQPGAADEVLAASGRRSRAYGKTVIAGVDADGRPKRAYRSVRGTEKEATKALAAFVADIGDGATIALRSTTVLTVDDLVAWYLPFARDDRGSDHSTITGYEDVYRNWLKPQLGHLRASALKNGHLTRTFGAMRRAGMSHSRMNNARALLSGPTSGASVSKKVSSNPVDWSLFATNQSASHIDRMGAT